MCLYFTVKKQYILDIIFKLQFEGALRFCRMNINKKQGSIVKMRITTNVLE